MKQIPSILDYILLLDYKIVDSGIDTLKLKSPKSNIDNSVMCKDGYLWLRAGSILYKTPFRCSPFLGKLPTEQELRKLVAIWISQYKLLRTFSTDNVFVRYGQVLADYFVGSTLCDNYYRPVMNYLDICNLIKTDKGPFTEDQLKYIIPLPFGYSFYIDFTDSYTRMAFSNVNSIHLINDPNVSILIRQRGNLVKGIIIGFIVLPSKDSIIYVPTIEQLLNAHIFKRQYIEETNTPADTFGLSFFQTMVAVSKEESSSDNLDNMLKSKLENCIVPFVFVLRDSGDYFIDNLPYLNKITDIIEKFVPSFYRSSYISTERILNISFFRCMSNIIKRYIVSMPSLQNFLNLIQKSYVEQFVNFENSLKNEIILKLKDAAFTKEVEIKDKTFIIKGFVISLIIGINNKTKNIVLLSSGPILSKRDENIYPIYSVNYLSDFKNIPLDFENFLTQRWLDMAEYEII